MKKKVSINGVASFFYSTGEGKDVLFLHGWGCTGAIFEAVMNGLSSSYRVWSVDFPGFGESEEPPSAWGIEEYTQWTEAFIREMGLDNPILVGHSFGGRVAILLASRNPLSKIILVGSAGIKPSRSIRYYLKIRAIRLAKRVSQFPPLQSLSAPVVSYFQKTLGSQDYKHASAKMRHVLSKVVNEDLQHVMPHIQAQTLLIWGDKDTATPLSDAKKMEKLIPHAGLALFEGAGHYSFLEQPRRFLDVVSIFLSQK